MQYVIKINRSVIIFLYDFIFSLICLYASLLIRHGSWEDVNLIKNLHISLLTVALIQSFCFYFLGLYKPIWRFSSTPDLVRVIKGVSVAVLSSTFVFFFWNRLENIPRTSLVIDWLLLIITLGGGRFSYRLWKDAIKFQGDNNVVIIGAGSSGEKLLREIKANSLVNMRVVGFIDDDPYKLRKTIHGIPVLGNISNISFITEKYKLHRILIAIPSATSEQMRKIVQECAKTKVKFKTLPGMGELLKGKSELLQLRNVETEDLLGRESVILDSENLKNMIEEKIVFVTGAGGSIGSELCNQICKFKPKALICFEMTELFLYKLEMDLKSKYPEINIIPVIGDVRSQQNVSSALSQFRPSIVFHAAAYKHVPLMEQNPGESINTNILGTKIVSQEAINHNVEKFVLISTDKAVRPTNVMGTTKRVAEMICQLSQSKQSITKFIVVRFGNVLGSSGSVIPLFKKQIEAGGPITITDPKIERYFMSIPEASQLVLQAGAIGNGGEVFILDMGSPVKIVDLANHMISLAGLIPDKDIKIEFIGLRPGEKLFEELFLSDEELMNTSHPKLQIAKAKIPNQNSEDIISNLLKNAKTSSKSELKILLQKLVPEYTPESDRENNNHVIH